MNTYVGTKIIKAKPMTRGEYTKLREWKLPKDENPADEGYLVEYPDSPANVEGFAGYVSWSPKAQFEAAYKQFEVKENEQPHIVRLLAELEQLASKYEKLSSFLTTNAASNVSETELMHLQAQAVHMNNYLAVLQQRAKLAGY